MKECNLTKGSVTYLECGLLLGEVPVHLLPCRGACSSGALFLNSAPTVSVIQILIK